MENSTILMNYSYEYDYDMPDFTPTVTTAIVVYSVLLYVGLCTNIWMLWSLYKTWETGSKSHFYLLAICVSDILGLCISCSTNIGLEATWSWKAGLYGCKIIMGLHMFGFLLGHFILAGFNVDNIIAIIGNRSSRILRMTFLVLAIGLTLLACAPQFFWYKEVNYGVKYVLKFCTFDTDGYEWYNQIWLFQAALLFALFWFPLFFMLFCGFPALCVWCGKKGDIKYHKMNQDDGSDTGMKTFGKDIGLAIAYDILFILCWSPTAVNDILQLSRSFPDMAYVLYRVCDYISTANSCLNPIIYGIFSCIYKRKGTVSPGL